MPELERSYRRWLLAYPAFYRRERGLEILTTLLDAAEPGQTRPSRGEAAYLLLMGLRYRFVPAHWFGRIATVLVAVWAAVALSGAGALVVWAAADPQKPDLAALSDTLAGRSPVDVGDVPGDGLLDMAIAYPASGEFTALGREGWAGARPAPMGSIRYYEGVTSPEAVLAGARQRLSAEGWQVGEVSDGVFWARHGQALIRVVAPEGGTAVDIGAFPVEPGGVLGGAIAGFAIGLILAWQAMTALTHRIARVPRSTPRLILLLALPGLATCAVNIVDNVLSMSPDVDVLLGNIPEHGQVFLAADLMYPLANQLGNPPAAGFIVVSLLCVIGLVATAGPLTATAEVS